MSRASAVKRSKDFLYDGIDVGTLLAHRAEPLTNVNITNAAREGRLLSQPQPVTEPAATGLIPLKTQHGRDALLYIPNTCSVHSHMPLVVALHGAGGQARNGIDLFKDQSEDAGFILLAPHSKGSTWDFVLGGYGPDVAYIDRCLEHVFTHYALDRKRLAVAGFSDGASYALSLGLSNGDLFTHVIAYSPGFMQPTGFNGRPRVYISHGDVDTVLPVQCSHRIVPKLHHAGYDVEYHQFDGGHSIPLEIRREATEWFSGR